MRKIFIGTIAVLAFTMTAAADPAFDRAAWFGDYAQMKAALEAGYSHLAWAGSPQSGVDLPALDRRTREALTRAASDEDAKLAIRDFVAGFHDGHFSELPATQSGTAAPEPSLRALEQNDAEGGCAALGYGERSQVAFSLPFESLAGFKLIADGAVTTFRAGEIGVDGKLVGIVRIKNFSQRQYLPECLRAWKQVSDHRASNFDEKITAGWFETLAAVLRGFRADGVPVVLVDVGSNSGGNDSADWAARLFTGKAVHSARLLMSASPQAAAYLDEQIAALSEARRSNKSAALKAPLAASLEMFQSRKTKLATRGCDMSWVWRERRAFDPDGCSRLLDVGWASGAYGTFEDVKPADRDIAAKFYWPAQVDAWRGSWTGATYVLTNATSYSAAEMFTAVMKDNGIARTVGDRTGGDGCGFMTDAPPLVLKRSGLRFRMANCVRLRADGTDEKSGISPDLPVISIDGESPRSRAMRVLTAIRADLAR